MSGSKLIADINMVKKSNGDKWIILCRKGEEIAALYYSTFDDVRIEHRSRGVYLIMSGWLHVIADDYRVCGY